MDFHLSFPVSPLPQKLEYGQSLAFIGSCFSENISDVLSKYKFDVLSNPHGIVYTPSAVAMVLRRCIAKKEMQEEELFLFNDCWSSAEHHGRFSHPDKQKCLLQINDGIKKAHAFLKASNWLFITYGSAMTYYQLDSGMPVANCHKLPQKHFSKKMNSVEEMYDEQQRALAELKRLNPKINIVLTVSPVRYVREGVVENNRSKARLIELVHRLAESNERVHYFPAYELVIDDLRDYRFFKEDLVHPNQQAIDYVFAKLKDALFSEQANAVFSRVQDIVQASEHRPFNSDTASHMKFRETYLQRCRDLVKEFPSLDLEKEIAYFSLF